MYADSTALRPVPPRAAPRSGSAALAGRLSDLADLLTATPAVERAELRSHIQEVQRDLRSSGGDHGLLALLLRNMLADLARSPARFDGGYFAEQLSRVANSLG